MRASPRVKTILLSFFVSLGLLSSMFGALSQTVYAAGETYTWNGFQSITLSGGDSSGSNTLNQFQPPEPAKPGFPAHGGLFGGQFNHKDGCVVNGITLTISADSRSGRMTAFPRASTGPPGSGPKLCSDSIFASYNNKTISIGGTRPGAGGSAETPFQKQVDVQLLSPKTRDASPANVTISIKNGSGQTIHSATVGQKLVENDVDYVTTFTLEPGSYQVCATYVITCQAFVKNKFEHKTLIYGERASGRSINVTVNAKYTGGPKDMVIGPAEVSLTKPDGSVVTATTNSRDHKMTEDEKNSGLITVTYTFPLRVDFNDLNPGQYKVCATDVNVCKTVTKVAGKNLPVTLDVDAIKLAAANSDDDDLDFCTQAFSGGGAILGSALTWLVCPLINNIINGAIGGLDTAINNMLTLDVDKMFDDKGDYHDAWIGFRTFALGLLVIAGLVMVISQAAGLELLDAYTARKIFPRFLWAGLFIVISWPVLKFGVELGNDLGNGIRYLIYSPFKDLAGNGQLGGGSVAVIALLSTGGALALGWIGLLSFVLTGLLAALIAFVLLVLREMVVIFLIITAPLAIACMVLPGTRKFWDIWQNTFIAAAVVIFAIIAGFIALGRVFSAIAFSRGDTASQLIAIFAYFLPYFLIPKAFTLAGGVIATIGGIANDRGRGAFDRLKGYRQRTASSNFNKLRTGERFRGSNALSKTFNRGTGTLGAFANAENKVGFLTNSRSRSAAFEQFNSMNSMAHAKSDRGQVAQHNDPLLRAQTYESAADARANMSRDWGMSSEDVENAIAAADANGGFSKAKQDFAARRLFATGTGYDNEAQVISTVARVAGQNANKAASIIGEGNSSTKGVGRFDLAGGFQNHMDLYNKVASGGELNQHDLDNYYMEAVRGNDAMSHVRGKPADLKNTMPVLRRQLERAQRDMVDATLSEAQRQNASMLAGQTAGIIETFESNAGMYAAPQMKTIVNQQVYTPSAPQRQAIQTEASRNPAELGYNEGLAAGRREQAPRTYGDPRDPNNPYNQP